ncbi:hypothetical protein [Bacillus altitudinis]|uniref:hypothetical protein n=1 Tax=Bacillus altitudinis TaxID=293387 RepID=UPI002100B8E0|nr:hypothetical protein [Bacillus altitudinis]UTV32005.1 hypothetical protein NM966_14645 [Bacillus altitudinis]
MAALKGVKTIDMVDGEITKVAYEGAEYERVEGEAEVGDIIRLPGNSYKHAIPGGFYAVISVIDRDVIVMENCGNHHRWTAGLYELFRKKHVRLKVGDYAKVVAGCIIGDAGNIVKISADDHGNIPYRCDVITGRRTGDWFWARESELVLATEDEVAAAKEAEAKRFIEAKWAKIGRKVDEYKVGDIAKYRSDGEICEVIKVEGYITMMTAKHGYCPELSEDIELITPVEARFDRS